MHPALGGGRYLGDWFHRARAGIQRRICSACKDAPWPGPRLFRAFSSLRADVLDSAAASLRAAGMLRPLRDPRGRIDGFSARMDAPTHTISKARPLPFHLRARGCPPIDPLIGFLHARDAPAWHRRRICLGFLPTCGDAPSQHCFPWHPSRFPPHTRRCTPDSMESSGPEGFLPRARMHPRQRHRASAPGGFLHARADAPNYAGYEIFQTALPPRARGCTPLLTSHHRHLHASSARAGMHPPVPAALATASRFPYAHGDAPDPALGLQRWSLFTIRADAPHDRYHRAWMHLGTHAPVCEVQQGSPERGDAS